MDDGRPLFQQIAELIEDSIIDGSLGEETRAPSTNELAAFHRINPATAANGINKLVADGLLYKKRGVGMFVAAGARDALLERRRTTFAEAYIAPLLVEARRLGMDAEDLKKMIDTWRDDA
ncbi:GntR family transcriptional regulator [Saccharomonospora piscinae]|uniref:GntR family transcriptional regulator n=1 Tax=Saccharomonospora piscinae TaxID=687388 RepID=A0A1V9A0R0_SACPI|nr:GntR family transcriptional regulator [Saccharomonospora piscinae]OQO90650.1 GntR family transcriptional regulator [Saccharomonospora piscinae]TLW93318.1 GntR family transcriptional regulator [Saccharomonospora piscinae]